MRNYLIYSLPFLLVFIQQGCQPGVSETAIPYQQDLYEIVPIEELPTDTPAPSPEGASEDVDQDPTSENPPYVSANKWPTLLISATIPAIGSEHPCLQNTESIFMYSAGVITEVLEGSTLIRYSAPIWSPDGSRVAYLRTELTNDEKPIGIDSIWVMDSSGANSKMVGGPRESLFVAEGTACFHLSGIVSRSINWSFDGDFLAYMTWDEHNDSTVAHVLEITTGTSKAVSLSEHAENIGWDDSNNILVVSEREFLSVHVINSFEAIQSSAVRYPQPYYVSYPSRVIFGRSAIISQLQVRNSNVIGSFYLINGQQREYTSIWHLDLRENVWAKVAEELPWGGPIFSGDLAIGCYISGDIAILPAGSIEANVTRIAHPRNEETWCYFARIVLLNDGTNAISTLTTIDGSYGIYVIEDPSIGILEAYLLSEEFERYSIREIEWYSWQPPQH